MFFLARLFHVVYHNVLVFVSCRVCRFGPQIVLFLLGAQSSAREIWLFFCITFEDRDLKFVLFLLEILSYSTLGCPLLPAIASS